MGRGKRGKNLPKRSYTSVRGDGETVRHVMELAAQNERDYFATCKEIEALREKTHAFCQMMKTFGASEREKTKRIKLLIKGLENPRLQREERILLLRLAEAVQNQPQLLDSSATKALTR